MVIGTQLSKFKHLLLFVNFLFTALTSSVYAAEQTYQTVLSVPNQSDILLHVFLPSGTPKGVLVALHGCGGLLSSNSKNGDKLSSRHTAMAEFANRHGWIAVFPDSFTTRGRREICTQKFVDRTIKQPQRKADALATARWMKKQNWGSGDHKNTLQDAPLKTVLLGWSNGGTTVLETIGDSKTADARKSPVDIAALIDQAVAFYPGCSRQLARNFRTNVPLTLFLGGMDDWTPAQPCIEMGQKIGARIFVYPEAHHGFDTPSGSVRLRAEVPNGVNPGKGVHVGPHPSSRAEAYEVLSKLLEAQATSVR